MTIEFIPGGTYISGSHAITSRLTLTTSPGGRPITASFVEFASESIGPQGPEYRIVGDISGSNRVSIINT